MKMYIAIMPEVWGYGYTAISEISEEDAVNKIREAYTFDMARIGQDLGCLESTKFEDRYDYYGGYSLQIDTDKIYTDGFK